MGDYIRSTRQCSFAELEPELRKALSEHMRSRELSDFETELLYCCETRSEKKQEKTVVKLLKGNSENNYRVTILVTPTWLIWARQGPTSSPKVVSARLNDIVVRDYSALITRDNGLEVSGAIGETGKYMRGLIALGPGPATQRLKEMLVNALKQAHPPKKAKRTLWERLMDRD